MKEFVNMKKEEKNALLTILWIISSLADSDLQINGWATGNMDGYWTIVVDHVDAHEDLYSFGFLDILQTEDVWFGRFFSQNTLLLIKELVAKMEVFPGYQSYVQDIIYRSDWLEIVDCAGTVLKAMKADLEITGDEAYSE